MPNTDPVARLLFINRSDKVLKGYFVAIQRSPMLSGFAQRVVVSTLSRTFGAAYAFKLCFTRGSTI
jgi:hypothetical protein